MFQRVSPDARVGKGAALNAAYLDVRRRMAGNADRVVIAVVDADGRLEPDVLDHVDPILRSPGTGAVQLMVRIFNRAHLLTRFQDFEFVSFSALLQRARQHIGSVGLGGNGQFVRLSALQSLGDAPWSDCLTEDLDLGIRLAMAGWDNRFTGSSVVSQQGVTNLGVLWRQRTRWIHGHMQCWKLIPDIVRSDLPTSAVADLLYYLAAPLVLALASILFTLPLILLVAGLTAGVSIDHQGWGAVVVAVIWYLVVLLRPSCSGPGATAPRGCLARPLDGVESPVVVLQLHLVRSRVAGTGPDRLPPQWMDQDGSARRSAGKRCSEAGVRGDR